MPVNNSIHDLHPDLAAVYTEAKAAYKAAHPGGLSPRLGETSRSAAVQAAYFAQGRQPLAAVNQLRQAAGLPAIGAAENARPVTRAQPGQSPHNFPVARAFDVQLVRPDGSIDWTPAAYTAFARFVQAAADKLGVKVSCGACWSGFPDYPHTELLHWRTLQTT